MTGQVYQIKIVLKYYKPAIWRRVLIPEKMLLSDFHKVIQTVMGWEDQHLHQFIKNKMYYQQKTDDNEYWDDMRDVDYEKIKICDLLTKVKEKITYEYDFGDCWDHEIILEKILPADEKINYPSCIAGELNCPPEDCGGPGGYEYLLEVLSNPAHEEYEELKEWVDEFDPFEFDIESRNKRLSKIFRKHK